MRDDAHTTARYEGPTRHARARGEGARRERTYAPGRKLGGATDAPPPRAVARRRPRAPLPSPLRYSRSSPRSPAHRRRRASTSARPSRRTAAATPSCRPSRSSDCAASRGRFRAAVGHAPSRRAHMRAKGGAGEYTQNRHDRCSLVYSAHAIQPSSSLSLHLPTHRAFRRELGDRVDAVRVARGLAPRRTFVVSRVVRREAPLVERRHTIEVLRNR